MIKLRRMGWSGHVARLRERERERERRRNAYKVLVGRPTGKRSSGGPRSVWEHNIKLD
jgi:hypothetical protein